MVGHPGNSPGQSEDGGFTGRSAYLAGYYPIIKFISNRFTKYCRTEDDQVIMLFVIITILNEVKLVNYYSSINTGLM